MNTMFLGIVIFLIVLAVFDLVVGVSNDAVNFLNSAIGAKVAKYRTIVLIAAIGVFAGAAMSNGMMDVARHGIMMPQYFSFYDVMCVFLAVMVTDVILLDIFNTMGLPTSTTVSMVFELLGGAFAIAIIQIVSGATDANGMVLSLGDLLNTEKAITCIMGIFLSVAVAFFFGTLVMWIARVILTFTYNRFIGWIARGVVLFGTGLLAFSFASNDLVNFVGVPLTGLDAYNDYMAPPWTCRARTRVTRCLARAVWHERWFAPPHAWQTALQLSYQRRWDNGLTRCYCLRASSDHQPDTQ